MSAHTATIRELRTDFRSVKKKIEQHGEIVITDHGAPAYVLKAVISQPPKRRRPLDYYARLLKRQPKPMPAEETRRFWEEERGDR
ncbi:MAG: type II toxin-antitoxin system Phd/YefM family antitoxin [Verrucomicrobia bacterium]|nr:type II toxin-antitoxin system Phd/YefM family antitoxin [Verrucomicrobiota bacterium]